MACPRRFFSPEFKLRVLQEVESGQSQASVARKHELSAHLIPVWRKAMQTGYLGAEATRAAPAEVRALERQVADPQWLAGKKKEQIEFLIKTARLAEQRNAAKRLTKSGGLSARKKADHARADFRHSRSYVEPT